MSSINSLTASSSGDITNVSSVLMYAVNNFASKKMSVGDLQDLGMGHLGAMFTNSSPFGIVINSFTQIPFDNVVYDTGSWTDSNSIGIFRVPDGTWGYVQIGGCVYLDNADSAQVNLVVTGSSAWPGAVVSAIVDIVAGDKARFSMMSPPIQISSGDTLALECYSNLANTVEASPHTNFWIRGVKRG